MEGNLTEIKCSMTNTSCKDYNIIWKGNHGKNVLMLKFSLMQ